MKADVLRRARIASCAFRDIANWREVLPRASAGKTVTEIRLRRGPVISATPEHSLWPHFSDIWYHQSYTKHFSIPSDSVVVDVGANVGVFSLFAARRARIVYALEPSSSNFSLLRSNTAAEKNIVPLNLACARADGEASLDVGSDPVSFSLTSNGSSSQREIVGVISLATLFERYKIERCDFLKLDCEGCEFEIILDSDPALMPRIDRIVMEYHDHRSTRFSHRDLLQALERLGFAVVPYNPNGTHGMIAAISKLLTSRIGEQA
jgi:FkbM family methyltransferase